MSRRSKPHRSRFVASFLLALGILVGGLAPSAFAASRVAQPSTQAHLKQQSLAPQIATASATLLIHGIANGQDSNGEGNRIMGGCDGSTTWQPLEQLLTSHGIYNYSLGYYSGDYSCGGDIIAYEHSNHHCANADDSGSLDGTWDDHDVHVACELAWYIYGVYTSQNEWVDLVAHSLGGVLIKEALYQIYVGNTPYSQYFPPYLYITHIVTIASPLAGVPLGGQFICGCLQVSEMQPNGAIYNDLTSVAGRAVGQAEGINWIMEGQAAGQLGCDHIGDSAFGMSYGFKVDYSYPINGISSLTDSCQANLGQWYYGHGTYLVDTSTASDVSVNYCAGCSTQDPSTQINNYTRSLETVYWGLTSYVVLNVSGEGAFLSKWQQTSDIRGPLGDATGLWYPVQGGQAQNFSGGGIYWSPATGTDEVQGAIYSEYVNVFNGATGGLGFPTTDEQGVAGGRVSYFYGNLCGGRGPNNSGAAIYYTSTTGVHLVGGCIYNHYWHDLGGPGGNSSFNLGFPTSDVLPITGGYVSYFYGNLCGARGPDRSGSAIYSSSRGTYMVGGCIYNSYWQYYGGPAGNSSYNLGFPTSDVQVIPGGYVSYFAGQFCGSGGPSGSGSAIYYSTSADEVQGCIYTEYVGLMNGPGGPLGFPVTNEQGIAGGRVSYFSGQSCSGGGPNGSGSAIYFNGSVAPSANEVQGCIYHEYVSVLGGPSNPNGLGFPIWDETGVASGRASYFSGQRCGGGGPAFGGVVSGSAIFWTSGTGAHEVQGCIYDKYWHMPAGINGQNQDGPGGALGFPLADEGGVTSGCTQLSARSSAFQHGAIYFYNGTAYEVQGSIYTAYQDNGGAGGVMGLPITDEFTYDSAGDRESEFENGYILYNKATGHINVVKFAPC